jgi:hypothetical protein
VRDFGHSPPSSDEVKNKQSYTSTPPICLNSTYTENVTFYLLFTVASVLEKGEKVTLVALVITRKAEKYLGPSDLVTQDLQKYVSD